MRMRSLLFTLLLHAHYWSAYQIVSVSGDASFVEDKDKLITTHLGNGKTFPLIGMGVGNLQHDLIVSQIVHGISGEIFKTASQQGGEGGESIPSETTKLMNYRLIDTARASQNEGLVHDGIIQGLGEISSSSSDDTDEDAVVHVITKVWYTHLGYERTKISVKESLEKLMSSSGDAKSPNIRVHVLLHWPRCDNNISWMNCEQEEENLPAYVKEASDPIPHENKDTAYLESWRALEDIFLGITHLGDDLPAVESIGISNFDIQDLQDLLKMARVVPHILQGNVWTYVFDRQLIKYCDYHYIHFQAYNVMNGIIGDYAMERSPRAYDMLKQVAHTISMADHKSGGHEYTVAQIVLKWLVQNDVSVIPRTTRLSHLQDNSPYAIGKMPHLLKAEEEKIITAIKALLQGQDLNQPQAEFTNTDQSNVKVHLYWKRASDGHEELVKADLLPGESFNTDTYNGHTFVAYDEHKQQRREFTVTADWGQMNNFRLEL